MKPVWAVANLPAPPKFRTAAAPADTAPGKSAQSIGHQARAFLAAVADPPANARGMTASAIARGIDPTTLFTLMTAEDSVSVSAEADLVDDADGPAAPTADGPEAITPEPDTDEVAPASPTPVEAAPEPEPEEPVVQSGAETALELLEDATGGI